MKDNIKPEDLHSANTKSFCNTQAKGKTSMNIIIRPKRTIYNYCTNKKETYEMTLNQRKQLNRYLNKYFRKFWQETKHK